MFPPPLEKTTVPDVPIFPVPSRAIMLLVAVLLLDVLETLLVAGSGALF